MISLSPSGVSNGARLISACAATRKRIIPIGWNTAPQPGSQPKSNESSRTSHEPAWLARPPRRGCRASVIPCSAAITSRRRLPKTMNAPTSVSPSVTS